MQLAQDLLDNAVDTFCGPAVDVEDWDIAALEREVARIFGLAAEELTALDLGQKNPDEMRAALWERALAKYSEKEEVVGRELLGRVERDIMLQVVDTQWKDHLYSLDHLKEGIGLRGYGQRDPLVEYKRESFDLFSDMKERIEEEIVRYLWLIRPVPAPAGAGRGARGDAEGGAASLPGRPAPRRPPPMSFSGGSAVPAMAGAVAGASGGAAAAVQRRPPRVGGDDAEVRTVRRDEPKVGRNDPCPCGSGKKYKKCHGA
jgi:preprotein translocase subunit SecA